MLKSAVGVSLTTSKVVSAVEVAPLMSVTVNVTLWLPAVLKINDGLTICAWEGVPSAAVQL